MLLAGWTELLLNTEGITDVATALLEHLDVNKKFDGLFDLIVLFWRMLIDEVSAAIDVLHRIGDDFNVTSFLAAIAQRARPMTQSKKKKHKTDASCESCSG